MEALKKPHSMVMQHSIKLGLKKGRGARVLYNITFGVHFVPFEKLN